jgi:hypothetical protein
MTRLIGPTLLLVSFISGFFALLGASSGQNERTEREFKEACAKVNGVAVWNRKYWECLK